MSDIWNWLLNLTPGRLDGGPARLALTSDWNNYAKLGLLALAAILVLLAIRCYRREGPTPNRIKAILGGLRVVVILLIVLLLFQPAIVVDLSEKLHDTVLILVDDSLSMATKDAYASQDVSALRGRLATRLGVPASNLGTLGRREILQMLLVGDEKNVSVLKTLNETHEIEIVRFSSAQPGKEPYCRTLLSLPRNSELFAPKVAGEADEAETAKAKKNLKTVLAALKSEGHATNLSQAMRGGVNLLQGRRIGAMVLLSDGQSTNANADERLKAAMEYLGAIPRYTVCFGDPTPPRNLTAHSLQMPREVRTGGTVEARLSLSQRNLTDQDVEIKLYRRKVGEAFPDDDDLAKRTPIARQTVRLRGEKDETAPGQTRGAQSVKVNFTPKGKILGEYVYRATVTPVAGEQNTEDNYADSFTKITDNKIRILLVSSDAGWEFRYLRNYFLRQPDLYRVSVWQQNADLEVNQAASNGMKLTRLPRKLKELIDSGAVDATVDTTKIVKGKADTIPPGYDVVMLYDPEPKTGGFDKHFMELLYDYVTIHRGGLCYISSNSNTEDIFKDKASKPLIDLLPVTVARNPNLEMLEGRVRAWPIHLTSYGLDHPVTKLEPTSRDNRELWSLLPGPYRTQLIGRVKPSARVLLENTNPSRKTQSKSLAEPLLAVHSAGSGRVAYVGFDETWRWRFVEDGYYYRKFWANIVRYLAPLHARQISIATGGDRFGIGDEIKIEVEAFDSEFKPMTAKTFLLDIRNTTTKTTETLTLRAEAGKPGRYRGNWQPSATGTFVLGCDKKIATPDRVASKQIIIARPQAESRRQEANTRAMTHIATRPAYAITPDAIDTLAKLIPNRPLTRKDQRIHPLWDTPLIWILLVTLLACEWWFRKRNNLA